MPQSGSFQSPYNGRFQVRIGDPRRANSLALSEVSLSSTTRRVSSRCRGDDSRGRVRSRPESLALRPIQHPSTTGRPNQLRLASSVSYASDASPTGDTARYLAVESPLRDGDDTSMDEGEAAVSLVEEVTPPGFGVSLSLSFSSSRSRCFRSHPTTLGLARMRRKKSFV